MQVAKYCAKRDLSWCAEVLNEQDSSSKLMSLTRWLRFFYLRRIVRRRPRLTKCQAASCRVVGLRHVDDAQRMALDAGCGWLLSICAELVDFLYNAG